MHSLNLAQSRRENKRYSIFSPIKYFINTSVLLTSMMLASQAMAQMPVVDTVISLSKTGSEPFDTSGGWTGDGPGGAVGGENAGQDASEDDNIVRLQDSITYRVEVSVNDSDVEDLTSTVTLNEKQKWITIPTGCKIDPADVGNQPVSSISADGTVLFCNLGPAIEGTTRVFFPAARAVGVDPITGDVTRNDDIVTAGVSSQAFSAANGASAPVTDGPTEVIVTGFFRVDLQKELKSTAVDPDTGAPLYQAPTKDGPTGRPGSIIEYTVLAKYVKGSLVADGDQDTTLGGSPGVASYRIVDVLTDDNIHNDTATNSTGARLYTWDTTQPACELLGDHGASASVTCSELVAAIDDVGPGATMPDGLNDLAIEINLTDIDVTDPDNDANLFEVRLNIWFDKVNDIDSHQVCNELMQPTCTNTTTNRVGFWDGTSTILDSFDENNDNAPLGNNPGIVSTEDASGSNVGNYNAGEEPFPNEVSYPLSTSRPGSFSAHKAFTNLFRYADAKFPDQSMAAGETRPFLMNVFDYRKIDQAETIMCDKIDTQVFEYAGVAPPNQIGSPALYSWNQNRPWNPVVSTFAGPNGTTLGDGTDYVEFFFTNHPYTTDPIADQAGYINEMRTATCDDDVNGDGSVVIQLEDGSLVDENGDPAVGTVDWWVSADDVPPFGGAGGAAANVTRVKQDSRYDAALANAQDPTHERFAIAVNHLITAKLIAASPYGSNNRLPNFASWNRQEADGSYLGWRHVGANTEDPDADATFSIQSGTADRMTLVSSSHSIAKRTEPSGIKVVRGGDVLDFVIEPQLFGIWNDLTSNTASVSDNLPNGTAYIANSEMFSSDNGATWHTRAEWDARFAAGTEDVSITSSPHAGGADPLNWAFGSVNSVGSVSDQLPWVKYSVFVDPARVSGTFVNIAVINSGDIGGDPKQARYQLTILPEFGLDVLKTVDEPIYEVNSPFSFDLVYKNLGGEDYSGGEFIDILPHNDDSTITTGGVLSSRDPGTRYSGIFEITSVTRSNGETFYATTAPPLSIEEDPCHASNLPLNFDPLVSGGVCQSYLEREGTLPGGGTLGTNAAGWVLCSTINPLSCGGFDNADITAIKFSAPELLAVEGGQTVTIELEPLGNVGGTPILDADGNVEDGAGSGDIYTNTFGGRIEEISLNVISNDVSVTVVSGSIGDTVWFDLDADGNGPAGVGDESDTSEPPIVGATVALLDSAGAPVYVDPATGGIVNSTYPGAIPYTTTTDSNGMYSFDNLPSDDYQVQVTPPAGSVPVYDADGIATPNISSYSLQPEMDSAGQLIGVENNEEQDFGYAPPLQIGSTVWLDVNNDGQQGPVGTEPGIAGVTVQLFRAGDDPLTATPVDSTVTDADGNYLLNTADAGDYFVYIPVPPSTASLSSTAPNTDTADNRQDGDDNGIQAAGGDPVMSPIITLTPGGEPTDALETGPTGGMLDNGLVDQNGDMTVDFGFYPTGSIGDTIYFDLDGNGSQSSSESGIAGVTVVLTYIDLDGVAITLNTVTALDGTYLFDDLPLGVDYTVTVDISTLPGTLGTDIVLTDDPDSMLNNTSMVRLTTTDPVDLDQDFGYQPRGSIGDTVWYDANADGVIDGTEQGIEGVTITLINNATGLSVATTMTNSDGNYLFPGLIPGDYSVVVDTSTFPAGSNYTQTYDDDGVATAHTSTAILALDNSNPADPFVSANIDQDFGYVEPVSIGGLIWEDVNGDGLQDANEPSIGGSTVTLLNADGSAVTDVDGNPVGPIVVGQDGQYIFDNLLEGDYKIQVTKPAGYLPTATQTAANEDDTPNDSNIASEPTTDVYESGVFTLSRGDEPAGGTEAQVGDTQDESTASVASDASGNMTVDFGFVQPASIGDYVWTDLDNDGVQDANESGIPGATVNLYEDVNGDGVISGSEETTPVATLTTGPDGEYLFPDLTPGVVYQVGVDPTTIPAGYSQTYDEGDGFGATDNLSDPITLDPGELHDTADFGYAPGPGSIGDTIWIDANDDGVVDPNELGIPGVTVTLTPAPDVDLGNGPGVPITTTTDDSGMYLFRGLPLNETYVVDVDESTLPVGYVSSPSGLGDPDVRDENSTTADSSTIIILTDDDPINLEADFGYLPPEDQNNSIGDTIWLDEDGDGTQNGAEPGIEGVTVALIDVTTGQVVATTTTDADGNYLFAGVPDGLYSVEVTDATGELSGFTQTGDPDGLATPNSSIVDLDSGSTSDVPVNDLDQDFGYQPPEPSNTGQIGDTIFLDTNGDGAPSSGEGIQGVVVQLYDSNGNLIATTTTDANGNYLFDELDVSSTGVTYEVRVDPTSLPNGVTNSVDPDDGVVNTSIVTLTDAAPVDLNQDFGYTSDDNNTIRGTVWPDTDGDGTQGESGSFAGVTIVLKDENGNIIAMTETDVDGNYEFTGLPDGIYTIEVTDDDNVLNGFEHTDSPNGTSDTGDGTSKDDTGYTVDLDSAGNDDDPVTDETGDFGYKPEITNPISLGSFVTIADGDNNVLFSWQTQTEVANLGFYLYAQVGGGWVRLNDELILGQGDSVELQAYQFSVVSNATVFALSDIDLEGKETLHGPFELGRTYGDVGERQSIDWEAERTERERKNSERLERKQQFQKQRMQQIKQSSIMTGEAA